MVDKRDLNLQLCSDDPIFVGGVPIYPIPISEIAKIGYMRFNAEVRLLCLSESDISAMTGNDISDIGVFKYLVANAMRDQGLMNTILFWLSIITHSRMKFSSRNLCFTCGAFNITQENFDEVQAVIRLRNGLQDIEEEEENPDNEAARRVLQRRKEERLKRKRLKEVDEESAITLADLVSILASGFGLTMADVMKYDIYQFNDQFNRLKIMDDYEVNVQALLHGAKKENVNSTHWITKIKHDPE